MQKHRAHVGLQIDGRPLIGEGHHPRRRSRTDAGQRQQPLVGFRKPTGPLGGAPVGRALERQGAAVVAEALPQLEHIGHRGGRQGIHRGKRRQEPFPEATDARHLGLLQHDLRDEHRVRIVHMAPRQIAVQLVSPGEHRGHKVIEGRPLAGPIYRFCILAADHRSRPPSSVVFTRKQSSRQKTGGSAPARSIRQTTTGYPTKSFKSPKEAEKSETTRRSSSAYSAESSGW